MERLFGGGDCLIFGLSGGALIRGRRLFNFWSHCWALIRGGAYLIFGLTGGAHNSGRRLFNFWFAGGALIRGRRLFNLWSHWWGAYSGMALNRVNTVPRLLSTKIECTICDGKHFLTNIFQRPEMLLVSLQILT